MLGKLDQWIKLTEGLAPAIRREQAEGAVANVTVDEPARLPWTRLGYNDKTAEALVRLWVAFAIRRHVTRAHGKPPAWVRDLGYDRLALLHEEGVHVGALKSATNLTTTQIRRALAEYGRELPLGSAPHPFPERAFGTDLLETQAADRVDR